MKVIEVHVVCSSLKHMECRTSLNHCTCNRGTQGLTYKLADELADEIHACEPAGGQPIESCAPFQVNSNFEGPG
jgi:hypothetical protein